jgi:hypothetical protein
VIQSTILAICFGCSKGQKIGNSTPKYPEKKIRLEELSEKISEMDNSIMMFVTFKKKK